MNRSPIVLIPVWATSDMICGAGHFRFRIARRTAPSARERAIDNTSEEWDAATVRSISSRNRTSRRAASAVATDDSRSRSSNGNPDMRRAK